MFLSKQVIVITNDNRFNHKHENQIPTANLHKRKTFVRTDEKR